MEKEVVLFKDVVRGTFKRWKLILIIFCCVVLLGGVMTLKITPEENSIGTVKLYVNDNNKQQQVLNGSNTNVTMIPTYIEFIKTRDFLDNVIKESNVNIKYEQLFPNLLVTMVTNTNFINIQYTGQKEEDVKGILTSIVDNFIDKANDYEKNVTVEIADKVNVKTNIEQKSALKIIVLAIIGGLFLGAGLAFVLECINRTYRTKGELERDLEMIPLGVIPKDKEFKNNKLIDFNLNSIEKEAFNSIIVKMKKVNREENIKTFMISSSSKSEGTTTVASNLSLALSNVDSKVLLIDANFINSNISKIFNSEKQEGLNDILVNNKIFENVITKYNDNLDILSSGKKLENQFKALEKYDVSKLFADIKEKYDFIIIDTDSIQKSATTQLLTTSVDGVIIVVGAEKINRSIVKNTLNITTELGGDIVGIILNSADTFRNKF